MCVLNRLSCYEKKTKLSAGDAFTVNIDDCLDRHWCDDDDDDCDNDGDDDDDIDDDFDIQGASASGAGLAASSSTTDQKTDTSNMSPLAVAMMKATWASAIQGFRGE